MSATSSEESKEKCSVSVLGGLLTELNLDFCAEDYSKYIKVDVSSEVLSRVYNIAFGDLN